jgi:predicted flap endonuclease-1-like 5' DNA nuclease
MDVFWVLLIIVIVVLLLWWLGRQEQREQPSGESKAAPMKGKDVSGLPDVAAVVAPVAEKPTEAFMEQLTHANEAEAVAADDAVPLTSVVGIENPIEHLAEEIPIKADDLEIIEGIGPKIAGLLKTKGIITFSQLACAELEDLQKILREANLRIADPSTWAEQAKLAGDGKWDDLKLLQDHLKGGRKVD